MENKKNLENVGVGETFKIAGIEFVKFYDENGQTVAVAKECLFNAYFGKNNNLAESNILKRLKEEILPNLEKEIGVNNVVEHEVDLLSLDGSDKWGTVKTKISIPTFDFYRKHVKIFDKYKVGKWWWLATPDTTSEHLNDDWVRCVAPSGGVDNDISNGDNSGVRPFLIFVSSILVSCEE